MEPHNNESFHYTYSAEQREEVLQIRQKYLPREDSKLEQLRRLDRSVTRRGTMVSIILGTIGALMLGIGMCCCMIWGNTMMIPGIIIGAIGILGICLAYPLSLRINRKERERLAPEILRLTDELMGK